MEKPEWSDRYSFTPKGYLVNQLLAEGWGWDAALAHASQLFSADGTQPSRLIVDLPFCQNVNAYIAACDQPAEGDDYQPRAEACGGLAVTA